MQIVMQRKFPVTPWHLPNIILLSFGVFRKPLYISEYYWKCNFPMTRSVRLRSVSRSVVPLVGRSVIISQKGREVSLPRFYRGT